jgi:hypothetical protein
LDITTAPTAPTAQAITGGMGSMIISPSQPAGTAPANPQSP